MNSSLSNDGLFWTALYHQYTETNTQLETSVILVLLRLSFDLTSLL